MRTLKSAKTIDHDIMDAVRENNPKTVEELIELVQLKHPVPEDEILRRILHLQNGGKLVLRKHPSPAIPRLRNYILSAKAAWYWTIIAIATTTAALVFTVPENAYPIVYARHVFGSLFVLFLPGYSFIKSLFPTKELDNIERVALSIGMSLALVPIVGLLLNYTAWGIGTTSITLSLLGITTILATVSIIREHQAQPKNTFDRK